MPKSHIVLESYIDNRKIKCSCGKLDCKMGINFDSDPVVMLLTDKYGNEHPMKLNKTNVKQLIKTLREYQQDLKEA